MYVHVDVNKYMYIVNTCHIHMSMNYRILQNIHIPCAYWEFSTITSMHYCQVLLGYVFLCFQSCQSMVGVQWVHVCVGPSGCTLTNFSKDSDDTMFSPFRTNENNHTLWHAYWSDSRTPANPWRHEQRNRSSTWPGVNQQSTVTFMMCQHVHVGAKVKRCECLSVLFFIKKMPNNRYYIRYTHNYRRDWAHTAHRVNTTSVWYGIHVHVQYCLCQLCLASNNHSNNGPMIRYTRLSIQDAHTVSVLPILRLAKSASNCLWFT